MIARERRRPRLDHEGHPPVRVIAVSEEPDLATIAAIVDNEHARTILAATSVEPMSAQELTERCDATLPTVYRLVDRLKAADLLREGTRIREDGHHDAVYVATLESIEITLTDGSFELSLDRRRGDPADELAALWEKF